MPDEPIIKVSNLTKTYGNKEKKFLALDSVSLSIMGNAKVAIMGPSGSGKSTLLQIIGGLDRPTSGTVLVDKKDVQKLSDSQLSTYRNQSIGFIFQAFNLQPYLSAMENVSLPLILSGSSPAQANEQALDYLNRVNLSDMAYKFPAQLSGGEMQRVAIARALIKKPLIILADEPTANLDKDNAENILSILINLKLENQSVVIVTHDERIAKRFDRLVELDHGHIAHDTVLSKSSSTNMETN